MKRLTFTLLIFMLLTQTAGAHAINGTLTGRYTAKVERWRPEVARFLKMHHLYSKEKEGRILNIIKQESGGSEGARNGSHAGLVQFNEGWKRGYSRSYFAKHQIRNYQRDNRLSGSWSIHRLITVAKVGGWAKVRQHWKATYYR